MIQNLALEAETAISRLPHTEWEVCRKMTAERINILQNNNKPPHTNTCSESKTIKNIKTKLKDNGAMIKRADNLL